MSNETSRHLSETSAKELSAEDVPVSWMQQELRKVSIGNDRNICGVDRVKLTRARRVVVKVGSQVVSRSCDSRLALGRLGSLIEQIEVLVRSGREVILVSSGSISAGRQRIRREMILNSSPLELQGFNKSAPMPNDRDVSKRASAACGQSGVMALYDLLFGHMDLACSQLLVTRNDFLNPDFVDGIKQTVDHLLKMNVIPVFNENDAINYSSKDETIEELKASGSFWDNDSLAMRLATHLGADLLVLLTDVEGLYTGPPQLETSELIDTYCPEIHDDLIKFGAKSSLGRGGMSSKCECAWMAAERGVPTVILNGKGFHQSLVEVVSGENIGTLFDAEAARAVLQRHDHQRNGSSADTRASNSDEGSPRKNMSHSSFQDAVIVN
uniref:Delta-1-pyrroline-5-carboxylate synthase-like n=1 Tax=Tetraselmis sp. GSL018 TaxID=582737 RepID=A0A061R3S7_9CHLO